MTSYRLLPLLLLFTSTGALADEPFRINLVKDLNTTPKVVNSEPQGYYAYNGKVYFTAYRQEVGNELFSTDGVASAATLVADMLPGPAWGSPRILGSAGNRLIAYSRVAGDDNFQLVSIDPLTGQFAQLTTLSASNNPGFYRLGEVAGHLLLQGVTNQSLWTIDGTAGGTVELLTGGLDNGIPAQSCLLGDRILFARRGAGGLEVWRSDGTASGTQQVRALAESGTLQSAGMAGGTCHFATSRNPGWAVWHSDGTATGTDLDRESAAGSPVLLGPVSGKTFLFVGGFDPPELWRIDQAQPLVTSLDMSHFAVAGNYALYTLPTSGGRRVLVHDGSNAAPRTVTLDGAPLVLALNTDVELVTIGELLFARGNGGLYRIDPATATSTRIADGADAFYFRSGIYMGGVAYGTGRVGTSGHEVFRSDGTPGGTRLLHDIATSTYGAFDSGYAFVERDNTLYFQGVEFVSGSLYNGIARSDGTPEGTQWLPRALYGNDISVGNLQAFEGGIAFSSFVAAISTNTAMFHVDPEFTQVTRLLQGATAPYAFSGGENLLVYSCDPPPLANGPICALRAGTNQPTQVSGDFSTGGPFMPLDVVGSTMIYFDHNKLWRSDGTVPGTYVLSNLQPWRHAQALPLSFIRPVYSQRYDGRLHFQGCLGDVPSTCSIYATDGSTGPTLLAPITDYVTAYGTYQGKLFFATSGSVAGTLGGQLWTSNGTPQTTQSVTTIPNEVYNFAEAGGLLHYIGRVGATDRYFVTDATAAGTRQVTLPVDPAPSRLREFDGNVVFACSGICVVDGAGTGLRQRIVGIDGVTILARVNGSLLFKADDGYRGNELWRLSYNTDHLFTDGFDD